MTVSILKQDPNAKRFKITLIYYDTVTLCAGKAKKSETRMTASKIITHKRLKRVLFITTK